MPVTFQFPSEVEEKLRTSNTDIDREAKEAYAVELFRQGRLSSLELSRILGLDRLETASYLKGHQVFEGSLSMTDLDSDRKTLDSVLSRAGR
jgi:predicted HTH domain antitoxin